MRILLTGGAGFIGSALTRELLSRGHEVCVLDLLTYAGVVASLADLEGDPAYSFVRADIADPVAVAAIFTDFRPEAVAHLAAETHVDRSIDGPAVFVRTNVVGTQVLLDQALVVWRALSGEARDRFRFLHVSTDEVFGSLGKEGFFSESSPYDPRSPYAASKAGSDHLVRAWRQTFGLPTIVSNCSNNYGARQFPEKLIPAMILRALRGANLPVYGDGANVRDWLFVDDHARALADILERGAPGRTYAVGGAAERTNLEVTHALCAILDRIRPAANGGRYAARIELVEDRPGHDRRYAIDPSLIQRELGWVPQVAFADGLEITVRWYLDNETWWTPLVAAPEGLARLGRG
ncbi:dTDP-glucose 4,6-dehydratase [uncultured Brevundimonas sp.]|uniref:dTDP-glucose 4,6-dehydratase n=1 Tax=uncultured Brevundimonas sp. TaxID=213418 RepID=UPI0025DA007E|nr:dTDP-glucose 4,6-dehydratase [uncultured Brevundimonas sp.]